VRIVPEDSTWVQLRRKVDYPRQRRRRAVSVYDVDARQECTPNGVKAPLRVSIRAKGLRQQRESPVGESEGLDGAAEVGSGAEKVRSCRGG